MAETESEKTASINIVNKQSDEAKKKIKDIDSVNKPSDEAKKKIKDINIVNKPSDEAKKKIKDINIINKPSDEAKKKTKDPKNHGLKKCFAALVNRKQVNLELEVLRLMLRKELDLNLDSLQPDLANILPYLLVYYMKIWPGWQKSVEYFSGNIAFKAWYDKFIKFISLKLNEAINIHYVELQNEKCAEVKEMYTSNEIVDKSIQTDNLAPKISAPFTIEIMAKPELLNTIVFTDTAEGDVILKQHNVLDWDKSVTDTITLKQLITWPHVGVHLNSSVFSFSRRNVHEFRRHISLVGTPLPSTQIDYIEEVEIINNKKARTAYTLDYLKELTTEFMLVLKNLYPTAAILEAFQTVIDEFLTDIEDINIKSNGKVSMASNTSVTFNIGKSTYFRNKKLSKGSPSRYDIGYTEVIIPKMEVSLNLVETEDKINQYFSCLKQFNPDTASNCVMPQITFSCCYCKKTFDNGGQIATHLKEKHKMEQAMLCAQCKHPFPAFELSKVRWAHNHVEKKS